MLILTRRMGETLMIGADVTVTVMGANGQQVRLGINAPKEVPVHREEVYDRMQAEKAQQSDSPNCDRGNDEEKSGASKRGALNRLR